MYDRPSLIINSLFLLMASILHIPYLWRQNQSKLKMTSLTPYTFLSLSLIFIAFAGFFMLFLGAENILLASALALGVTLSALHPVTAICFFMASLLLRPWEASPHNIFLATLPRLLASMTFLTWVFHLIRAQNSRIVWNFLCWLFTFFLAWLFICALFSTQADKSLTFFFETFSPIAVLCFLIVNSLWEQKDLEIFSHTLVVCVLGVLCVAMYITVRDYSLDPKFFRLHGIGLWGNANDIGALAVFVLPLALTPLALRRNQSKITTLALALVASAIPFICVLWSQSRGALAGLIVGGLGYFAFCTKTKKTTVLAIAMVLSVPLLFYYLPERTSEDLATSTISRTNYTIAGLKMVKAHPFMGVGINNYAALYEQYTPAFLEWGSRTAHSSWVLILAESGVIGFVLFVGLYVSTLRYAWRMRKELPQFLLIMLSYGMAMSFLSHTYLFLPYVMMAIVLAAARIHSSKTSLTSKGALLHDAASQKIIQSNGAINFRPSWRCAGVALFLFCCFSQSKVGLKAEELKTLGACVGADKPIGNIEPVMSQSLSLHGSRGESVLFLLKASGQGCFPISASFPVTLGKSLSVYFYALSPVTTEKPSFPGAFVGPHLDPLIPIRSGQTCFTSASPKNWILGELKIAVDLSPGVYQGNIVVGPKELPLSIKVWRMIIPEQPILPAYAEMTPWFLLLGHHGKWQNDEAELAQAYITAMIENRIYPLKSTIAALDIVGTGSQVQLDITQKPTPQSAFSSIVLKQRPLWAYYDFPTVGSSGFEPIDYSKAALYFSAVENTITQIGRPGKAIVYLWDEPKPEIQTELVRLSRFVKKHAPSLKQLVTTPYQSELKDSVDIFVPVMDQFDAPNFPPPQTYRVFQKAGHEVWWYVSCMSHGCEALVDSGVPDMVLDRPSSYVRSIGWLSMKYKLDGFLYYSVNNGFQFNPKRDPWQSLWDFSGNGDGTLFYPGRPGEHGLSQHMPIASLRLKLWRESSYDAEYVRWMEQLKEKPAWWENDFAALVRSTTTWSRDYSKYQVLRDKAGDYLDKHAKGV